MIRCNCDQCAYMRGFTKMLAIGAICQVVFAAVGVLAFAGFAVALLLGWGSP